ncbi:hypothetical protein D3C72_1023540 [compost metagenome]
MNIGIITAASEKYANSLFSLIGSLNCNWANHPPIVVYDLGLSPQTLAILKKARIEVRSIPAFCSHWRAHYTWKLWCMTYSEFDLVIWMDAGLCVLDNLDEVIEITKNRSYFLVPNYQFLDYEASEQTCNACGVPHVFRIGKGTLAGGFIGFLQNSEFGKLMRNAFEIALTEDNIKAHNNRHKNDQSIISLLAYKQFPNPVLEDGLKYLGWSSPKMVENQKVWVQRRNILKKDIKIYKSNLAQIGNKHIPKDPSDLTLFEKIYKKSIIKAKSVGKKLLRRDIKNGIK